MCVCFAQNVVPLCLYTQSLYVYIHMCVVRADRWVRRATYVSLYFESSAKIRACLPILLLLLPLPSPDARCRLLVLYRLWNGMENNWITWTTCTRSTFVRFRPHELHSQSTSELYGYRTYSAKHYENVYVWETAWVRVICACVHVSVFASSMSEQLKSVQLWARMQSIWFYCSA